MPASLFLPSSEEAMPSTSFEPVQTASKSLSESRRSRARGSAMTGLGSGSSSWM